MEVTTIKFSKTVQVNQYEPETLEVTATLDEGENFEKCAADLRSRVTGVLGGKAGVSTAKSTDAGSGAGKKDVEKKAPKNTKKSSGAGAEKKTTKATKSRKKSVAYNREIKAHQTELGKLLHEVSPEWKQDDALKKAAKQASIDLTGEDFMDGEGVILDSFREAVSNAMGSESESEDEGL